MAFYDGDKLPGWRGSLFNGSLKFGYIARLELDDNNKVINEERLLEARLQRVRDIRQGPDGYLYVLDEAQGRLYRIEPAD
ncbi:MAG: PQQ-dependent sugar dehydrogenase [Gammaproteobacteria bacterium]|nr:PQQ-dependent sugar dehydrogenase [Gammaproteobacteria bacterium]